MTGHRLRTPIAVVTIPLATLAGTGAARLDLGWVPATMPFMMVVAIAAATLCIFLTGRRHGGPFGALLMVQAGYFFLGFVIRPAVLLFVQPGPRAGDPIHDPRLYTLGYGNGMIPVLGAVLLGVATYLLTTFLATRRDRSWDGHWMLMRQRHLMWLFAVGWTARIVSLGFTNSLVSTAAIVGSVAVGLLVLYSPRLSPATLLATMASEMAWSLLTETKTPMLSLILWLVVRAVVRGGNLPWKVWLPTGAVGLAAFSLIQNQRIDSGRLTSFGVWEDGYAPVLQPLLPIIARFDLFFAATDGVSAGVGSWLSPGDWASRLVTGLLPRQVVGEKQLAGELWGTEVRPLSLLGSRPGAHLAEGPVSEGFVIGGHLGVVVQVVAVVIVTLLVARAFRSRHLLTTAFAVAMTTQPFLFERGLLGITEGVGKSVQVALLTAMMLATVTWILGPLSAKDSREELDSTERGQPTQAAREFR